MKWAEGRALPKIKLKATSQEKRIQQWKQHFENLLGNPPKVTHEPITRIISKQLVIKLGQFTQEELDSVLRRIKNRKAAGLDEIPSEVGKSREFEGILLRHYDAKIYNALVRNCIEPKSKKIFRKNQNGFWRNRSTISQILTIHRILEGIRAKKNMWKQYYLSNSPRPLTRYTEGRWSKYYSPRAYSKKPSQP